MLRWDSWKYAVQNKTLKNLLDLVYEFMYVTT